MKYFNVIERGTFFISVDECKDITKLSDHFITEDQLKELCGKDISYYATKLYFSHKIRTVIEEWILIIPPNALSTTLITSNVRILLNEVNTDKLRFHSPNGYSIKGRRLYNTTNLDARATEKHEADAKIQEVHQKILEAQPYERYQRCTSDDVWVLASAIRKAIEEKYEVHVEHRGYHKTRLIQFAKRVCNWPEIRRIIKGRKKPKIYLQDIKWIKKIWDDPEISSSR